MAREQPNEFYHLARELDAAARAALAELVDWRKAAQSDRATTPRARRKRRAVYAELEEIAAKLGEILTEVEAAFEAWLGAPSDDGSSAEELAALAKRFRSRLRELVESCRTVQLSKPAEAAASPPIEDAPEAGLLQ